MKNLALATALLALTGTGLLLGPVGCTPDPADSAKAVEESLTCQCGCGLTVHTCNHLQCSFAVPVRLEVRKRLAAGESAAQILEHFRKEYGEKVLSSPVPEGFNLLAWYGPYIALFSATAIVLLVIRRWTGRLAPEGGSDAGVTDAGTAGNNPAGTMSDADRDRLKRELEDYEP